jgi:hypothetical protein
VTPFMQALGQDVVLFAFFTSLMFIVGYTALAKWWKSEIGWARISLDFGIAVALSPTFLHVTFGIHVDDSPAFAWYTISAIAFVGLVALWNLALVARVQSKRQRRQDDSDAIDRNASPEG